MEWEDFIYFIIGLMIILSFTYIIIGITTSSISNRNCNMKCENKKAETYLVIPNGNYFNTEDYCICFYKNTFDSFRLK